jgi:hypothetical protein
VGGFAIGVSLAHLPDAKVAIVIVLALVLVPLIYMLATVPRNKGCLFCGDRDTVMVPRVGAQVSWWMPLRGRDVSWVCQHHFTNWIRLALPVDAGK